jgi:predicted acetyltransferase
MADPYPIRPITEDELPAFRSVHYHAFHGGPGRTQPEFRDRLFEAERSLAAFDPARSGSDPVGVTGIYTFGMAVPGAVLPVAGVTMVGVLPTYRRRGILRSLMHRQLTDIAVRGEEPIAALWASETPIYGRFGYGRASAHGYFRFERGEGALDSKAPHDPQLSLRLAGPDDVAADLAKVYDSVLTGQPGLYTRSGDWWQRLLYDPEDERNGFSPLRCVLAEDGTGVRGYAIYRANGRWDDQTGLPDSTLVIKELIGADPAATAALWHDLLGRDLVTTVTAENRPAEDPVLFQLLDQRRARARIADGIWVRIIDLPAALTKRSYSGAVDVVLEVSDPLLAANAGRWRLRADGHGDVSCGRTTDAADIAVDIRELGAAYLGGTRLGTLAAAGLVTELQPGTLRPLSAAMSWDPAPWCAQIF